MICMVPRRRLAALLALVCLASFGETLRTTHFIHDDHFIIEANPLLNQGLRSLPALLTTGYWEPALGPTAPVAEYRPVLMLSFWAQAAATGLRAWPFHAANVLLHALVAFLLWQLLLRKLGKGAAAAAALVFAALPVHLEAVAWLTGRSEIMAAAFVLGSWLCLDGYPSSARTAAGLGLYSAALLTKESSLAAPLLLAMNDWVFLGKTPWSPERRRIQAALWSASLGYLLLRLALLPQAARSGIPYFQSGRLIAALTLSRFFLAHYLWPSLTGLGLCSDFSRPLIPDATLGSALEWLCLSLVAGSAALAAWLLVRRRSKPAFWLLGPCLFLLPTSHLLIPLDTIGAQRFLYIPSIALAVGIGGLFEIFERRSASAATLSLAALIGWYGWVSFEKSLRWSTPIGFYEDAAACNPSSARARSPLGAELILQGRTAEGIADLQEAVRLDPAFDDSYYNLARLAWDRKDAAESERLLRKAVELNHSGADSWELLGVVLEAAGKDDEALDCLARAAELHPWDATAQYNLGRLWLKKGRSKPAIEHLKMYLTLSPGEPDAAKVAEIVAGLEGRSRSNP
jgi:protein O-mannosyl-transferase